MNKTPQQTDEEEDQALLQQPKITDEEAAKRKKKKLCVIFVVILVIVGVGLAIALPLALSSGDDNPPPPPPPQPDIQEYNPYYANEEKITRRSYNEEGTVEFNETVEAPLYQSYLRNMEPEEHDELLTNIYYRPVDPKSILYNDDINKRAMNIKYQVDMLSTHSARMEFFDADAAKSYRVPNEIFYHPPNNVEAKLNQVGYERKNAPFSMSFKNIYTNEVLASTADRKLMVSEKFSEIGFTLPTKKLFGLGQHNAQLILTNGTYSLYSRGWKQTQPVDNALGGISGAHIHPFLLVQTQNKDFMGMFFVSANAQAFEILHFEGYKEVALNYITLGGHIEVYLFMGGSANEIISMYQRLVGTAQMVPFYSLGIIQGSQLPVADLKKLVEDPDHQSLSLGGYQIDNYYNDGDLFNPNDVALGELIDYIHSSNRCVFLGMQSSYKDDNTLFAKTTADTLGISVKRASDQKSLVGQMNKQSVNYPDYFNTKTKDFYTQGVQNLMTKANINLIDGVDLQGLQFANEVNGEVDPTPPTLNLKPTQLFGTKESQVGLNGTYLVEEDLLVKSYKYIPFVPGYDNSEYLDTMTISPDAQHAGHATDDVYTEYYLHNANGKLAAERVKEALQTGSRRTMVITDASWSGAQRNSIAAITNLERSYDDMKRTISQAIGLSIFGYSGIMIDACGTKGPFDEEMCARWLQMAAFMPMARNYYTKTYYDKTTKADVKNPGSEIQNFKDFNNVLKCTAAMQTKLSYSLYVYSQMFEIQKNGGAIVRHLQFEFPHDDNIVNLGDITKNSELTYMLGDSILVAPAFDGKDDGKQTVYFPKGTWVNVNKYSDIRISNGQAFDDVARNPSYVNAYLRPGKIIPYQQNQALLKTPADFYASLKTTIVINRDANFAEGSIYIDDGLTTGSNYNQWKIQMRNKNIQFMLHDGDVDYEPDNCSQNKLEEIRILNAGDLMTTNFACYFDKTFSSFPLMYNLEKDKSVLTLKFPQGASAKFKDINVIHFGDSSKEANICSNGLGFKIDPDTIKNSDKLDSVTFDLKSFGGDANYPVLKVTATLESDDGRVRVAMVPSDHDPYIPNEMIQTPTAPVTLKLSQFFSYQTDPNVLFSYTIHEKGDKTKIMYKSNPTKLYASKYFTIDGALLNMYKAQGPFFGLGERSGPFFYDKEVNGIHTRFTFDAANPIENGKPPGKNFYGFQPFYGFLAKSNEQFLGVLNWNPRATDFILDNNNEIQQHLDTVSIGGAIVKYFVRGKTIEDLVIQHQSIIGKPVLTPLWAFGWQQSRFGYLNDAEWKKVVDSYGDFPLDVMWADIDFLQDYVTFTLSDTYSNLTRYIENNHENNIRFVPIVDVGIGRQEKVKGQDYVARKKGFESDIFLKAPNGENLIGNSWPGDVYWPDYTNPKTKEWLHVMLDYMRDTLKLDFDGIWFDMNEATNNCNGYCDPRQKGATTAKANIFYVPGGRDIETMAITFDAVHANGKSEMDMHNMFSYFQTKAASEYFTENKKRPFILSRSDFPGLGQYGFTWLADNYISKEYLRLSVEQMYQYSLFGIPFVGSDICGFMQPSLQKLQDIAELCTRWHQLGSFYPFMRNHNNAGNVGHEPYVFKDMKIGTTDTTYYDLIKTAVSRKYDVIRYYFSEFARISTEGGSFFKPLSFDWSDDPNTYENKYIANNIMLGSMLKLSIQVTDMSQASTEYYFPKGRWCSIYPDIGTCFDSAGNGGENSKHTYPSTINDYQVHMLGGYILPYQYKSAVKNVVELQSKQLSLAVLPLSELFIVDQGSCKGMVSAAGSVFFDNGHSLAKKLVRFNILFAPTTDGGAQIFVCEPTVSDPTGNEEEKLLELFILGVREAGLSQSMSAAIYLTTEPQKKVALTDPVYDPERNLLHVVAKVGEESKSLYQIARIDLTPK